MELKQNCLFIPYPSYGILSCGEQEIPVAYIKISKEKYVMKYKYKTLYQTMYKEKDRKIEADNAPRTLTEAFDSTQDVVRMPSSPPPHFSTPLVFQNECQITLFSPVIMSCTPETWTKMGPGCMQEYCKMY
jgi:hypothetical protein